MSFNLFRENKLETLADCFIRKVYNSSEPSGLTDPGCIVVVQTRGMAEYLKQHIALQCGIAANLQMPFLNSFINGLFNKLYGSSFSEALKRSSKEAMRSRLMQLLSDQKYVKNHLPELTGYVSGVNCELKRWQLAGKLADIFDQYMLYRSDDLAAGKLFASLPWQGRLFGELFNNECVGRNVFLEKLRQEGVPDGAELPSQISIFGVGALPPVYLDIFVRLSEKCDVNFFYLSPCLEYWEYQLSRQERRKEAWSIDESGNPILQALGRQGRGFFSALLANDRIAPEWEPSFKAPDDDPGSTMLEVMQHDILHLFNRSGNGDGETVGRAMSELKNDRTVSIHNCHSVRRELEILHDELLKIIKNNEVAPQDIIVMAPDIVKIAPQIHAVFGNGALSKVYSIADLPPADENMAFTTFHRIISAAAGRFEYSEIIALLDLEPVSTMLELAEGDLPRIEQWLQQAGVRWGFDGNMREKFCGNNFDEYSWQMAMDRLLAGFACRSAGNAPLLNQVKVCEALEDSDIELFARVVRLLEELNMLSSEITRHCSMSEWLNIFNHIVDTFFNRSNRHRTALAPLRRALHELQKMISENTFPGEYPLNAAMAVLDDLWTFNGENGRFLRGKITFCRMMPMRSIPMKVVAILELNEGNYPRREDGVGFDLITVNAREGDRSQPVQDRYLLLESLLAARKYLMFFYQGRSSRNNKEQPPCAPLGEIAAYLKDAFDLDEYKHKLSGIDPEYFLKNAPYASLNCENFLAVQALRSSSCTSNSVFDELPPEFAGMDHSQDITIDQLVNFLENPCRWMLRNQLGLYYRSEDPTEDSEPWLLTRLNNWEIDTLLAENQHVLSQQDILTHAMRGNMLPPGEVGRQEFARRLAVSQTLPQNWQEHLATMEKMPVSCRIKIHDTECLLHGMVNVSCDNSSVLHTQFSSYKAKGALKLLLGTLIAAVSQNRPMRGELLNLANDNFEQRFIAEIPPDAAREKLKQILEFATGRYSVPPPLFPKSSPFFYDLKIAAKKFNDFRFDSQSNIGDVGDENIRVFYKAENWADENFQTMFNACAAMLYSSITLRQEDNVQ